MKKRIPKDIAASVRQKLLDLARQRGDEFQLVLTHYGVERLLYRLSRSQYADRFILKGAMLMAVWTSRPYRPTRDLDLSGRGDSSVPGVESLFQEVCRTKVEKDGLVFDETSVHGEMIREDQEYEGVRITLMAALGIARIPLQVDIGFGDSIVPSPQPLTYPTLLDYPAPNVKAYSRETTVAEKFQAMVALGPANSRMKDFYDVWLLARLFGFDGWVLSEAIRATFERRDTLFPTDVPFALTDEFVSDRVKQTQWGAFVSRGRFVEKPPLFVEVVMLLRDFVMPPMRAAAAGQQFVKRWNPGGSWQ